MIGKTVSNRYKITEEVNQDSLTVLYKAQDQSENKPVYIQLLKDRTKERPLETLLRFKREINQLSKLDHPNLLKTLSQGEFESQDYIIYEYFDSKPLPRYLGQPLSTDIAVEIILQVSSALDLAHQNGILHQALQPQSILITQDLKTAKLTNFGHNMLIDISRITEFNEIISTFGYLSPESSGILRKPIDARSDIYSVGVLFYQLITGRLPYTATDVATLIHQHIAQNPPSPVSINNKIPPAIENMVLRLIAKEPQERYQSLSGLAADLKEYQKQRKEGKEFIDFEIARGDRLAQLSFSTRLIGRDKELDLLKGSLDQAKNSKGSFCTVFGEPGIGKSRLVDELRANIHSLNGIFCGGKCYQYEFRTPYKVFSETVDAYIEKVKRLPQEEQDVHVKRIKDALGELGGVIVKIAPAIIDLIGEPPKLVELEPEKERIRFLITVTNFILSLSFKDSPLLIFLDDLQWVDEGSLDILGRLAEKISSASLVIIASYRDTDVDINHPLVQNLKKLNEKNIPIAEIPIKAFAIKETAQMISQILIEKEENMLPLAVNLQERAKGNPFFTLELLRTLVEEKIVYLKDNRYTFDLAKLNAASLPENIIEVVLKRVEAMPEQDLQVLSYASVMGKEINFQLLTELIQKPFDVVLNSIENGMHNQLIYRDITGRENIFFMHDRIREAFYQRVPAQEKAPLHRRIGQVMEERAKGNTDPVLYDLAYHFTQGQLEEKALEYSIPAAHKAQNAYAQNLAINLYNASKQILERQNKTNSADYIGVLENLGEVYRLAGKFDLSLANLKEAEGLIPRADTLRKVQVLSKMGDTLWDNGKAEESAKILEQALKVLGVYIPRTIMEVFLGINVQFTTQMLHTIFPKLLVSGEYKEDTRKLSIIRIFSRLFHAYYFSDMNRTLYYFLRCLNLAEKIGPCPELAYSYISAVGAWGAFPWYRRIERDFKKGIEMSQKLNDRIREGTGYGYYSCFGCYIRDKGIEGLSYAQKAVSILKPLGEYWELGVGYVFINFNSFITGNLQEALKSDEEFIQVMKQADALQPLGWALYHRAYLSSMIGDVSDELIEDIKESTRLMIKTRDKANEAYSLSILAYAYLQRREYALARETIEKAVPMVDRLKGPWSFDIFNKGAQIYLETIAQNPGISSEQKKAYLKRAAWYIFRARFFALTFPYLIGWTCQGWGTYLWLSGKRKKAVKIWEKGIKFLREKTKDKYRLGCVLLEEATYLLQDNPNDKKALGYLLESKELFIESGCQVES
ncbi:MAG: AAA family ATPase [Candidatus Omnitrophica bacterium]|nr:AAA family ATPase [Candidatus Omnitrophota bacterium]